MGIFCNLGGQLETPGLVILGDDPTMQKSVHVGDLEETENTETERVEVANCSRVVFPCLCEQLLSLK